MLLHVMCYLARGAWNTGCLLRWNDKDDPHHGGEIQADRIENSLVVQGAGHTHSIFAYDLYSSGRVSTTGVQLEEELTTKHG